MSQEQELPVPEFADLRDAIHWMVAWVDDPCTDNIRFAFNDNEEQIGKYNRLQNNGCCGFFDREVKIAGRLGTIGCNYGH